MFSVWRCGRKIMTSSLSMNRLIVINGCYHDYHQLPILLISHSLAQRSRTTARMRWSPSINIINGCYHDYHHYHQSPLLLLLFSLTLFRSLALAHDGVINGNYQCYNYHQSPPLVFSLASARARRRGCAGAPRGG